MARILADRVLESSTSTGTGAFALAGAVTGFRRFSTVCAIGDVVPYFIEALDSLGQPTGDYEYGLGTYSSANTLTRTTVLGSSNAGAAVSFSAGTKNVANTMLASGFKGVTTGSNGYRTHPDGTIEQWIYGTTNGSGIASVTWPLQFPNAVFGVTLQEFHVGYRAWPSSVTAVGASANLQRTDTLAAAGAGDLVFFRAIGN